MSKQERKPRVSSNQYSYSVRTIVDGIDDPKIQALKHSDPVAYQWYLEFNEQEAKRHQYYSENDALAHSEAGVDLTDIPSPDDAEELITNAIDFHNTLHRLDASVLVGALKAAVRDGRLDNYLIDLRKADTGAYQWTISFIQSERDKASDQAGARRSRSAFKRRHQELNPEELQAARKKAMEKKRRKLMKKKPLEPSR